MLVKNTSSEQDTNLYINFRTKNAMNQSEFTRLVLAAVILAVIVSFNSIINKDFLIIFPAIITSAVILAANIGSKKLVASFYDADVEHDFWHVHRYGFKPHKHFKRKLPAGVFIPLIATAITLGYLRLMSILSYETCAKKKRAEGKGGFYTFTEVTEWENGLIGAAGIAALLALSFISYWIPGLELLFKMSALYAFWNIIPFSKLDGMQIFFGSRVLWTALALISAVFAAYAVVLA